ncbi:MAG: hypothetical protein JNN07_02690 [Verrucomicrobiales bacterium]|nr:hypothetical protein [Verrucomicrobiales bacterium]
MNEPVHTSDTKKSPRHCSLNRRRFLSGLAAVGWCSQNWLVPHAAALDKPEPFVQTVTGPIPAAKLGRTLVHEHVMCDFVGAGQTGRHRWDVDTVVKRMLPYLRELRDRGFTGFVDCSPAFIGRDPRVLKQLAEATGLHLITNTGYYGGANDKFVPPHAYDESADQLAGRWTAEWERGIEDTGVKPGFLKIGVDEVKGDSVRLSEIDEKLVRAAAITSGRTGLSVTCHTGGGPAGLAATRLFAEQGGMPSRFVVAHSDSHGLSFNQQIAELGAWVSFDAVSRRPLEQHLKLVAALLEKHAGRLLLSQDNGWYNVGQEDGGEVRGFTYLNDTLLPALRAAGVAQAAIDRLTIQNPAQVLGITPLKPR